jgi:hypothetical protein
MASFSYLSRGLITRKCYVSLVLHRRCVRLAVASLAEMPAIAPALTIYATCGHARERPSLRGTVTQVDQIGVASPCIGLPRTKMGWRSGPISKFFGCRQTVYKNGSWANLVPGAVVRITGQGGRVPGVALTQRIGPVKYRFVSHKLVS